MKKGMNEFGIPSGISREEEFKMVAAAGFDGLEFNLDQALTNAELDELKELSKKYGVEIIGFVANKLWQYKLTSNCAEEREKAKELVKMLVTHAEYVGCDSVLVVPGVVNEETSYIQAWNNAQTALRELIPFLEEHKVTVCIENVWNKFLTSAMDMAKFVDELGCEYIKTYFDAGNVLLWAYPEHWVEILGSRIKKLHVKDFSRAIGNISGFVGLMEGDMDWKKLVEALDSVGYNGFMTVEVPFYKSAPELFLNNCSKQLDIILGK